MDNSIQIVNHNSKLAGQAVAPHRPDLSSERPAQNWCTNCSARKDSGGTVTDVKVSVDEAPAFVIPAF